MHQAGNKKVDVPGQGGGGRQIRTMRHTRQAFDKDEDAPGQGKDVDALGLR